MKKTLFWLFIVVVLAGWLGTLIARDPGYVLIAYEDYTLQTSFWVLIALLVVIGLVISATLGLISWLRSTPLVYAGWNEDRKTARGSKLTQKGLTLLMEGESARARKYLDSGAENSSAKSINYLAAARAADETGDAVARETYLRLSVENDADLKSARDMTEAELAFARGDYLACLAALAETRTNKRVVRLKQASLAALKEWRGMLELLPTLVKSDKSAAKEYEVSAAKLGFAELRGDNAELKELFKSLSSDAKINEEVLVAYVDGLADTELAEPVIRQAIRQKFYGSLVERYGDLSSGSLKTRRKTAESWLKHHGDEAALHYCLGAIYEQSGEKEKARESLLKSLAIRPGPRANKRLANLYAVEGDLVSSNEHLRLALDQLQALRDPD